MQAKLPVLACTDSNTDVGKIIVGGGFGWWVKSDNASNFYDTIKCILEENFESKSIAACNCLRHCFSVDKAYSIITRKTINSKRREFREKNSCF